MELLQQVVAQAEDIQIQRMYESVESELGEAFDAAVQLVMEADGVDIEAATTICECLTRDRMSVIEAEIAADLESEEGHKVAKKSKLQESVDIQFQADVALLETATEQSIVGVHDLISEAFGRAVNKIVKQDRKLSLVDANGKAKYKSIKAVAAKNGAAKMTSIFGKRSVTARAAAAAQKIVNR